MILTHTQSLIDTLEAQIASFRSGALKTLNGNQALQEIYTLITSIKGIAEASAIQLLGELLTMPDDLTVTNNGWLMQAWIQGISNQAVAWPKGQKSAKQAIGISARPCYMPALAASRYEPHVAAYYKHLQEKRGLQKIQAICAVMRKLLHAIYGMLHNRQPFDGSKFFDMEAA